LTLAVAVAAGATATATAAAAAATPATAPIRRRLLKRLDFPLHKIPIELAIGIIRPQLQRRFIRLHRISPLCNGLLRRGLLNLLPRAIQRVAQVVVGILLVRQAPGITARSGVDRILEGL
jgi:hypothetical protein